PIPGASPIHRLYNPNAGHHYLTLSDGERDFLVAHGWLVEPDQGYMFAGAQAGTTEIFHLYNVNTGDHFYTESDSERTIVLANPTQPPPWVQQTSLGRAVPSTATASTPPQQSGAHSLGADGLPIFVGAASQVESDQTDSSPAIGVEPNGSLLETVDASATADDSSTISADTGNDPGEASTDALDAVWEELGSGLLEEI
ncbi:MAG TPA: hypothetical protein VNM37_17790, partial [Candidatus Dormibacteraeota bacterium]|nr:hypothetical protein [Candidatus Dormibacteraeota bacterium]